MCLFLSKITSIKKTRVLKDKILVLITETQQQHYKTGVRSYEQNKNLNNPKILAAKARI